MALINNYYREVLTNSGGNFSYDLSDNNLSIYVLEASSITLSNDISISFSNAVNGMCVNIYYDGATDLNGYYFDIAGFNIPQSTANTSFILKLMYVNGSWFGTTSTTPYNNYYGTNETSLTNGGGTITLVPGVDKNVQIITGSPTLAGDWDIVLGTPASQGDNFEIYYKATPDTNGHTVTIGGVALTTAQAESGNLYSKATYDGSSWSSGSVSLLNSLYCSSDLCTNVNRRTLSYIVSFESNEQNTQTIKFFNNFKVVNVGLQVIKTLAGTNDATVDFGFGYCDNGSCTVSTGAVTFTVPLSSTYTYEDQVALFNTPISVNNLNDLSTYNLYNVMTIQGSKVTAGGKVRIDVEIEMV